MADDFHARYDVKSKEYMYLIWNKKQRNPFLNGRCWHIPKCITDDGIVEMNKAVQHLLGTHDFSSYMASGSKIEDTVRTIYSASVEKNDDTICFKISADGFLYNMVRIIMGTLVEVAEGKIKAEDIVDITKSANRARAGITAPPQGLYLNKVVY